MNTLSTTTKALGLAILSAALVGNIGCAKMSWQPSKMFSLDNTWPFRDKTKPREGIPVRMVGTWTDTVMSQLGQKPQRGFGGRIMFYEKDEKDPIKVDGQLIVYAFEETDREPTDNKPTRRYVFPAEQMPLHMSKSELGASYSVWLPWDEAGGPRTEVSLICRFEPKGGAVVMSEQTKHPLPGTEPVVGAKGSKKPPKLPAGVPAKPVIPTLESIQAKRAEDHHAKLANYETPADTDPQATSQPASPAPADRHMTSTTITLPSNFQMPTAEFMMTQMNQAQAGSGLTPYRQPTLTPQQFLQKNAAAQAPAAPAAPANFAAPASYNSQIPQAVPPSTLMPGQQPYGFNALQSPQTPMMQQQAMQTALQQQIIQQQMLQRQAFAQRALPNQLPNQLPQPVAGQAPIQTATTAGANSQAVVTYR